MFRIAFAQNIVPNNGFETYSSLPTGYGQWYKASGWLNLNGFAMFAWPYASPDYLHNTGSGGVDLPVSTFGTVTPFTGNAVMGLLTYYLTTPEYREYISIQFSTPMVAGTPYTVSFWVTNGTAGYYCNSGANHFGIRFSVAPLSQVDHEPIGGIPQLEYPGEIWSTGWQYVSFSYTPDQNYNYITIGNFYSDAYTTHTVHVAAIATAAYYFIDEVVVTPAVPLPVTLTQLKAELNNNAVDISWQTESELNSDYFSIEKSLDGIRFYEIGTIKGAGFSNTNISYLFTDDAPAQDINYYRLKMVDLNGDEKRSDMVSVVYAADIIMLYPNPCSGYFNIAGIDQMYDVDIFDLEGNKVASISNLNGVQQINIEKLSTGIYFVRFRYNNISVIKKLFIK